MQRYKLTKARMNSVKAKKKEREGDGTGGGRGGYF